jgi:arsenical pump membrane protein
VREAAAQAWEPFVLVAGLLVVGAVAHADGVFDAAAALLGRVPGPPAALYGGALLLVALTTAVLNLDTAVVFLTPVLVLAARRRGVAEEPFLVAALVMANAGSLLLPGANLTNLLVLRVEDVPGAVFFSRLWPAAVTAASTTALVLLVAYARVLRDRGGTVPAPPARRPGALGATATVAVAVLVLVLRDPALPVVAVALASGAVAVARGRVRPRALWHALGARVLAALFVLAVLLGALARAWNGPADLLAHAGRWGTMGIAATASVLVNNLPAAVLLSARPPSHPRALLLGLNLGPNLFVTGSLAAWLWWRAAGTVGARPSLRALLRVGIPAAIVALVASTAMLGLGARP